MISNLRAKSELAPGARMVQLDDVKARILSVPPDRMPLYAGWITEIVAGIYTEHTLDSTWLPRIREELQRHAPHRATLLLVSEIVDAQSTGGATAPAGYREASILLTLPLVDPLFGGEEAWMRVLYTIPGARNRGLAGGLLTRAKEILAQRGLRVLRADAFYGDDAIVGLFERREFERGRMELRREL